MARVKVLWTLRILALACIIFGCSDSGGGTKDDLAKESAGLTSDGHDLVVFNPGDLDEVLFKIDTLQITDSSFFARLHFRNLPSNKTPESGDIINSSRTKNVPYGFLYRVIEVAKEDGNVTIITVSYASIAEAVEEADIEFEVPLIYNEENSTVQVLEKKSWWKRLGDAVVKVVSTVVNTVVEIVETVYDVLAGNWDIGGTEGMTFSVNKEQSFGNANAGGKVRLNGEYILSLTTKIKLKHYSLDYAKMSIAQNKYLKLSGELNGNLAYENDFDLANFRLPDIQFMVGPVYVYLQNSAVIKAKVDAKAQANVNATLIFSEFSEYGFEYNNGFHKINTCVKDFNFDYNYSAYGSVRLGVLVGFNSLFYGVAGLELSAGPSLELKSPLLPLSAISETTLDSDLDVNVKVKLEFLDFLSRSWDFGSLRIPLGNIAKSKTLPSFDFKIADFDLTEIALGKLSFPFKIDKPSLGFSIEEAGFCMEAKAGECVKGAGYGLGKFGVVTGSIVRFEGLVSGLYNIIPYFKSMDGKYHYYTEKAIAFTIDNDTVADTTGEFVNDKFGYRYGIVKIGNQYWMNENLNTNTDRSRCYNDDPRNCRIYGKLYDWADAMNLPESCNTSSCLDQIETSHQGICPTGWHIPSDSDWYGLIMIAGGGSSSTAGKHLKAKTGWNSNGNGLDTYDFSALPGGRYSDSSFYDAGYRGHWWGSYERGINAGDSVIAGSRHMDYANDFATTYYESDGFTTYHESKTSLYSIRCIKD